MDLNNSLPGVQKIHRHHIPMFCGHIPNMPAARKFAAALDKHSWNRNKAIYDLRCSRNQRISVRSERRETYDALALAFVAHCDYNPDHEYLFELMASVEELARLTGQYHQCDNGRKTYDPVLSALKDWEEAKLIIIHREFDHEAKQHKAMRIWIRPQFFETLGFSVSELRDMMTKFRRWMERKGLRETLQQRYQRHLLRIGRSNVAGLDNAHSLKRLLRKIKREVLPTEAAQADEKHKVVSELEQQLLAAEEALKTSREPEQRYYYQLYTKWSASQPVFITHPLESSIKGAYPELKGEALYKLLVESIPKG